MRLLFLLVLASAVTASAQRNNVVLDAINNSVRMAQQIRSAQALRETAVAMHETAETLKVERERIRAETELLREQTLQLQEQRQSSDSTTIEDPSAPPTVLVTREEIAVAAQAFRDLQLNYGEYDRYGDSMMAYFKILFESDPWSDADSIRVSIMAVYLLARWELDENFEFWLGLPTDLKQPDIPSPPTDVHQAAQTR